MLQFTSNGVVKGLRPPIDLLRRHCGEKPDFGCGSRSSVLCVGFFEAMLETPFLIPDVTQCGKQWSESNLLRSKYNLIIKQERIN